MNWTVTESGYFYNDTVFWAHIVGCAPKGMWLWAVGTCGNYGRTTHDGYCHQIETAKVICDLLLKELESEKVSSVHEIQPAT